MNKIISVLCLSAFLTDCHNNESAGSKQAEKDTAYSILGKVSGQDTGMIYIRHEQNGITDSTKLDHGFFKFNGKADTVELCYLFLPEERKKFFLENGKISILVKKDSMDFALISGTRVQDEYNFFNNNLLKPLSDQANELGKAFYIAQYKNNRKAVDSINKAAETIMQAQKNLISDYARSHPNSIVAAYEIYKLSEFGGNIGPGQLDSLYQLLDTTVRASYFGRMIFRVEKERSDSSGK